MSVTPKIEFDNDGLPIPPKRKIEFDEEGLPIPGKVKVPKAAGEDFISKVKRIATQLVTNIKGPGGEIKTPEYPRTAGEVPTQVSQKEVEPIFKPTVGAVSESTSIPKIDVKAIREQKAYEKKIADETPKEIPYFGGALGTTLRAIDSEYSPIGQLGVGDFIDDMGRAIASGVNQGDIVTPANALLLAGKNASPEQIQKYIEAAKDYEKIGASDEMMKFSKTYQDEGKTIYGFLKGLAENPGVVGELIVSSVSAMANPSSLAAAGAVTGGFATSGAVGGGAPGATAGAISSIPWAIGAAGTALETGLTFSELLNDKLKENNLDFTEENVRALLEDEKTLKDIRTKSLARGATIGAIDALTGRLAGKVGAKLVGNTAASRVKAGLAASGIEMVGGSIGEASGRLVAGQPMDVAEIGLEGIAEGPMAIADITSEVLRRPIYKVNGEKRTEADVEEIINTSSPEELSKINIDIKNDIKGYKNKIENIVLNNEMRNEIRQANPKADDATIDTLLGLENELKTFENNKTQSGKERASSIRSQIKTIQQDVAQKQEVVEPVSEAVKLAPEVPELTLTEQLSKRMAEIESEEKGAAGEVAPEVPAAEKVEQLRAAEQAEYAAMPDPNDKVKRKEIYDKYDKLITPLLEKEKAESKAAPDELSRALKDVGENTPDKNSLATSSGLIIHAGDTKIDKLDLSKVKGGARGIYGKGIYFTDSPYKAADYGGEFTYLDKSKLSIIDTKETINQDFVKSIKDVAKKFERAGDIEKSFAYNLFAEKLQAEINGERSIDDAWKNVRDRFAVDKTNTWNSLLKDLGYDTIKNGYEYVVFDADKGNAALVKDANSYISEAYYKGDNSKLTKSVNELLGIREEAVPTKQEVPAAAPVPSIIEVKSPKEVKQGDTVVWRGEDFTVSEVNAKGGFNLQNKKDRTWTVKDARITDEEFEGKRGEVAAAPAVQKFGVGFAPFREKNVFTEEEDVDIRTSPDYQLHQENVQKVAEGLGIKINNKLDTWGGYVDSETGRPVQEVSNIMEIEATPEQARVMAAILGKAAPEMQDSVLLGNYNEQGAGLEHIVKTGSFANAQEAIKLLKDNGLQYFSVDKNSGDVIILDLDATDTPKIVNLVKQLNENGISAKHKYGKVNAEFIGSGDYDGIIEAERGRIGAETGFDIDAFVKEAAGKYDAIKAAAKPVVPEVQQSIADKIRGLKIDLSKLGGGGAQSNIAGLPVALYNTVVEAVALAVEAGVSINKAIKDAVVKYNLDRQKGFNEPELVNNIAKTIGADLSKSVSDIDVNEVRTKSRPGKRVSKGLSVYTKDKKKVIEEAEELSLDYVKKNAPEVFISNANIIANYPIVKGVKDFGTVKTLDQAQEVYDTFVKQISDNLKYLMSEYKLEFRDIATLWYDGANIIAQEFSNKYGVSEEQAAGIIASLSPQKDWYQNVRLAEMVMMAFNENPTFTREMLNKQKSIIGEGEKPKLKAIKKAEQAYKKSRSKANAEKLLAKKKAHEKFMKKASSILSMLQSYEGKKLNQVPNYIKPYIVRLSNELNTTKDYNILSPDGKTMGVAMKADNKTKAKVAWGSYTEIGKAVSIYLDGSQENITRTLGEMHKIRNFYNNIIDPMSKDNDVTMDTHAVAAALLLPLSGNSKEVGQNFGTGTSNSGPLGIKGIYYAFAEGYKKAADDSGLLPRQVQSITWEAVRGLFTDTFKRNKAEVAKIKDIWNNYLNGKIDINETRKQITESAGGINDPSWAESITGGRGLVQAELGEGTGGTGIGGGRAVSERAAVGAEPGGRGRERGARASVEKATKAVRSLKIKQQGLQTNIAGIPIAIYNAALETIATALEAGASLKDAIDQAIKKHQLNKQKGFNVKEFIKPLEDASGQTYPKVGGTYAIQIETAGEVPVQPKARVSEEVEGREPGAKLEEAPKEAKAEGKEKVTPGEMVGIKHEATEEMRLAYSLPEYERPEGKTMDELEAEADQKIKAGYNVESLIKKLEDGNPPSGVENVILAKYLGVLNADFDKTKNKETLAKIERVVSALDIIGTIQSEAFRTRKIMKPKEDTLAQYFMDEKADAGVEELTEQQEATITREYEEIKAAKEALQKKVEELQEQNAKLLAEGNIAEEKKKVKKTRKTDSDFKQERKNIVTNIKDKLKKARTQSNVTVVPYANELFTISPEIAKLVKSYVEQGIVKLEDIVNNIHELLKDDIKDITKKDVQDLIAGEYQKKKPTKNELAAKVRDLKTEAKLLAEYEKLEAGIPKTEKQKIEKNRNLTELRKKIKENDLTKLSEAKSRMKAQIEKVEQQIAKGDFEKAPEKKVIKLDEEGRKLQAKLTKLKKERDVRRLTLQYQKQNKVQRTFNKVLEVFNIPRSLMASTDFSAPLNQAVIATINYPKEAKDAAVQMVKAAASQEAFDNWFYDLKETPRYELMNKLKLGIADPFNPELQAREEAFMSGYAEQIPGLGKLVKGSERAYVQYLNKLRVDLFNKFVDKFENDGKTYENSKKLYESAAKYVNNITGRGELGKLKKFAPLFSALFFSPRLMAARINMLNPIYFVTLPTELKKQYGKDMGTALGLLSTMLTLFALYGKTQDDDDEDKITVETDPRSSDFARVKQGDSRWDFSGGFQPYLRATSQYFSGQRKKTSTGEIMELEGKIPGTGKEDILISFFRNKLAPVPAMIWNFSTGKNAVGEKVELKDELLKNVIPLSFQSIYEGYEKKGPQAIATVGLPAIFGVGVSTYGERKKEVPETIMFQDRKIELTEEQREEFQRIFDERNTKNLERLKALPDYKNSDKIMRGELEQLIGNKSLSESKEILGKKYRRDFLIQPKETESKEKARVKSRFKID